MERKIAAVRTLKQARAFLLCVRSQPARVAEAQVLEMVALAWSEGKLFARRLEREILVSRLHYAYSLTPKSVEVWWFWLIVLKRLLEDQF
jgi:hypothetical protein